MSEAEENMEKLQKFVKAGPEYLEKNLELGMRYVTDSVVPVLKDVVKDLCCEIEERHRLNENEEKKQNFVIHYTSIGTLVSMLQQAAKNKQNAAKDEQKSSKDEKTASLRLYDSLHFNDPDEGNYFYRHLNLPKKYDWLGGKKESHAYISSFIHDPKKDMSDELVFWRTYGRDGEGCSLKLSIPSGQLRKVLYGPAEVQKTGKRLRSVLDSLSPLVSVSKSSLKEKIQKVREELAETVWESLARILYLYKSEAYAYERECRFVIHKSDIDESKICFEYQEQNNFSARMRHYCEDEALAIKRILPSDSLITLGPCVPYRHDVCHCIEVLKRKADLHGPKIRISTITYRKS